MTAELEMAEGIFKEKEFEEYGKTGYSKKCEQEDMKLF